MISYFKIALLTFLAVLSSPANAAPTIQVEWDLYIVSPTENTGASYFILETKIDSGDYVAAPNITPITTTTYSIDLAGRPGATVTAHIKACRPGSYATPPQTPDECSDWSEEVSTAILYTATAIANSNGTISPASRTGIVYNDTTTFTTTPNTGYTESPVTGCGGSLVGHTYTTGPITENCTVTASFLDLTAPTSPSGLTATPVSNTQINLSWTAATDGVGITGYNIERCTGLNCSNTPANFVEIISTSGIGTTYNNTGLANNTTYEYRVRARDASSNYSGYSNNSSVSTVITYTVISSAGLNGSISPLGAQQVISGNTASFIVTAVNGYAPIVATGTGNCGGTLTAGTYPVYTYVTNAISAACNVAVTFSDTIAPTVSITAPTNGLLISGNQTVSAIAADGVGVVSVVFKLDGTTTLGTDTTSPYSITWTTNTASDGTHVLTAVACDAIPNCTTSAPINVTVDNVVPIISNPTCQLSLEYYKAVAHMPENCKRNAPVSHYKAILSGF